MSFQIKNILVPVDFSEAGEKALDQATYLAGLNNASLILLHVIDSPANTYGPDYLGASKEFKAEFELMLHNTVKERMEELKKKISKEGLVNVEYYIESGKVYKAVIEVANRIKADIIMMGTHGVSGTKEFFVGSNTFKVVGKTHCPVLSFQQKVTKKGFTSILLPFRAKAHSREDVGHAIELAKLNNAEIHVLGINVDPDKAALKKLQHEADQIKELLDKNGIKYTIDVVTTNYTTDFILSFAENKHADLLVVVSDTDRTGLSEYITGSVAQQLVNHSQIPVLSVHPKFHASHVNQANPFIN